MQTITNLINTMSIPSTYRAAVIKKKGGPFEIETKSIPELKPDQVLMKVGVYCI